MIARLLRILGGAKRGTSGVANLSVAQNQRTGSFLPRLGIRHRHTIFRTGRKKKTVAGAARVRLVAFLSAGVPLAMAENATGQKKTDLFSWPPRRDFGCSREICLAARATIQRDGYGFSRRGWTDGFLAFSGFTLARGCLSDGTGIAAELW